MEGEQRGMILDGPVGRDVEGLLGHEEGHVGHHAQVGAERFHLRPGVLALEGGGLEEGQAVFAGRVGERVRALSGLFGTGVDADDVLSPLHQRLEDARAEGLLAVDDDSHWGLYR